MPGSNAPNLTPKAPAAPTAKSMAPQQLWQMQPQDIVPDSMPSAKTVPATVVPVQELNPHFDPNAIVGGRYSPDGPGGTHRIRITDPNAYQMGDQLDQHMGNHAAAHEAGHAMYNQDLSDDQKQTWTNIHNKVLSDYQKTNDPRVLMNAVSQFPKDPAHSFAEAFGDYATEPQDMQKRNPDAYNFFKNLTGFEYSRKRIK